MFSRICILTYNRDYLNARKSFKDIAIKQIKAFLAAFLDALCCSPHALWYIAWQAIVLCFSLQALCYIFFQERDALCFSLNA